MDIKIRKENAADIPDIHTINEKAFGQSVESVLVDNLRRNNKFILSLVAIVNGKAAGHILFTLAKILTDEQIVQAVCLAPMAVLPGYQNMEIGSLLIRKGLEKLKRAGHRIIIVLGHPEFYPRFGFLPASRYNIKYEYEVPDEAFMILELKKNSLTGIKGIVKFESEFDAAL